MKSSLRYLTRERFLNDEPGRSDADRGDIDVELSASAANTVSHHSEDIIVALAGRDLQALGAEQFSLFIDNPDLGGGAAEVYAAKVTMFLLHLIVPPFFVDQYLEYLSL
jgi:hypothetical protein